MLDIGLGVGVQALWQRHLLLDYTIIVQGRSFQVHKVVMAAISDFFRALLCDQFVESTMDETELKGQSADVVEKVLEFVYNGDEDFITQHALDILGCAMYLQMPAVIDICIQKLMDNLDCKNWHHVLSTFNTYSLDKEAEKVKDYVRDNWETVNESFKPEEMTFHVIELVVEEWKKSEMDLFLLINVWASVDMQEREKALDSLMSQVRFSLINLNDLETIREMLVFCETTGSWHALVEKAVEYHQLPIHMKVLDVSEQTTLRSKPSPVFFTTGTSEDSSNFYSLEGKSIWKKLKALNTPKFAELGAIGIEINNYFVVCTDRYGENAAWHIFNPRTLSWSEIASMPRPMEHFVLVHYSSHLYVIGDVFAPETHTCERYSFSDNTWSTFSTLPFSYETFAACVVRDTLYVLGHNESEASTKELRVPKPDCELSSLNLTSEGQQWERKSECPRINGEVFVMKINDEDVILVINVNVDIHYYRPTQDQWSQFKHTFPEPGDEWADVMVLSGDNSIFYLNIDMEEDRPDDDDDPEEASQVCQEWKIPTNGNQGTVVRLADFPIVYDLRYRGDSINPFGALLAL